MPGYTRIGWGRSQRQRRGFKTVRLVSKGSREDVRNTYYEMLDHGSRANARWWYTSGQAVSFDGVFPVFWQADTYELGSVSSMCGHQDHEYSRERP